MDKLSNARRKNQAYQTYYGPETLVTNAFTRDMAADAVTARRSWFPTIATAQWFGSRSYNTKRDNIQITRGKNVKDMDRARMRTTMPGQIVNMHTMAVPSIQQGLEDGVQGHTLLYILIIVIGLVMLSLFI